MTATYYNPSTAVASFMNAADLSTFEQQREKSGLVKSCLSEEFSELLEAVDNHISNPTSQTRENLCKEWADVLYVMYQASNYFSIPALEVFKRVHESNMTKVIDGKLKRREDGKVLKPEGYQPPDMSGL